MSTERDMFGDFAGPARLAREFADYPEEFDPED